MRIVARPDFGLDSIVMIAHGLGAQVQKSGNGFCVHAASQQAQNLRCPRSQLAKRLRGPGKTVGREHSCDVLAQVAPSTCDSGDCRDELAWRTARGEVAHGARSECLEGKTGAQMHRKDQDAGLPVPFMTAPHRIQPTSTRQVQIHDHDDRLAGLVLLIRLIGVVSLRTITKSALAFQKAAVTFPDDRVVINHQDRRLAHEYDSAPTTGITAAMRIPALVRPMHKLPPSAAIRSRIPSMPLPGDRLSISASPPPSSSTDRAIVSDVCATLNITSDGEPCRTALVKHSWAMR